MPVCNCRQCYTERSMVGRCPLTLTARVCRRGILESDHRRHQVVCVTHYTLASSQRRYAPASKRSTARVMSHVVHWRRARNARKNVPSHVTCLVIFETQKRTALTVHDPYFCEGLGRHVSGDTNRFLCNTAEGGEEREGIRSVNKDGLKHTLWRTHDFFYPRIVTS